MNFKFPRIKNRMFRKFLGILFIILGIIGLFLPILQGILFLIIGLGLLGNRKIETSFRKSLRKIKKKIVRPFQKTL